jgi:hypothetical protein
MVYFQTKKKNLLHLGMSENETILVYFMAICYIFGHLLYFWPFVIFNGNLLDFMAIFGIFHGHLAYFSCFGQLYQ